MAVEDRSVQVSWGALDPGEVTVEIRARDDPRELTVEHRLVSTGGPGTVTMGGLEPDRPYEAILVGAGPTRRPLRFSTLSPPPGAELFRLATLSDLHLGIDHFDVRRRMREQLAPGEDPHPLRCARAACRELAAWGARHLIVKGDITDRGQPEQWDQARAVLGHLDLPVDAICGNHDTKTVPGALTPAQGAARAGLALHEEPTALDLPGLRVVLAPTTVPGHSRGRIDHARAREVADLVGGTPNPVLLVIHHQLQRLPVNWFWPPGIPSPQARHFLDLVAAAQPRLLVTSGHTHRHRTQRRRGVVVTEVGSPKDFPGVWAGYVVHEGGIRQVVRRIEAPESAAWLQRTAGAAWGLWGRWSPGSLDDRCFTVAWRRGETRGGTDGKG